LTVSGILFWKIDISTRSDQVVFLKVINVQEAKTRLSRLIDQVVAGESVLLGKHGKPLVKLTPYAPQKEERLLGGLERKIRISADFDEPDSRIVRLFAGEVE